MESIFDNFLPKMLKNSNENKNKQTNGNGSGCLLKTGDDTKLIIDLDYVVEKFIMYMNNETKEGKIKNYDDVEIIVNWKRVEIIQDDAKFNLAFDDSTPKIPISQTLFRTTFTNTTDTEQEYSFKTERKTAQTCSYTFQQGFCKTKEGGVKFKLPEEILEIGGGISYEQSVDYGKDETKSDEVTWGVDNIVKVQPHTRSLAELVIDEQQLSTEFTVEVKMSGRLSITINKRSTNTFVSGTTADIYQVFELVMAKNLIPKLNSIFEIVTINEKRYVKAILKGRCDFRLAVSQHITLSQQPI